MSYGLWLMANGLWPFAWSICLVPYVLRPMPADLWPMVMAYALWPMACGLWPRAYVLCLRPYGVWLVAFAPCHGIWPLAFGLLSLVYDVSLTLSPVLVGLRLGIEVGP